MLADAVVEVLYLSCSMYYEIVADIFSFILSQTNFQQLIFRSLAYLNVIFVVFLCEFVVFVGFFVFYCM